MAHLVLSNASLAFGHVPLLDHADFQLDPGERVALIGRNGTGKSSLLRALAGEGPLDDGGVWRQPGIRMGYVSQEPPFDPEQSVFEAVVSGMGELSALLAEYHAVSHALGEPDADHDVLLERMHDLQTTLEARDAWSFEAQAEKVIQRFSLDPDARVGSLSGGQKKRLALAQALAISPDLLLLDEPTNHLDAESVGWLERHLSEYKGAIVAVTHDRYFLDNVAEWILELDRGKGHPFEGNYSSWLEAKHKRMAQADRVDKARERVLAAELEWVRQNPKGRRVKSKARLNNYEALLAQEKDVKLDQVQIHIPAGPRLGDIVVEAEGLSKGFGDRLLIEDLNFTLPRGGIVGVIGPNGAGKTTLFKMITGEEQPDSGALRVGDTVQLAYVDQSRDALDDSKNVWEEVSGGLDQIKVGEQWMNSRQYVSSFNFKGTDQQKKVGKLSGGERNRLQLAKVLHAGGNLLMLDEPTNDLDTDTLRALEEALLDFAGCAVVISHDRWFLDRVATHVLAFEGDSQVTWFEGNFEAYEEHRRELLGAEADRPHRISYKRLTR